MPTTKKNLFAYRELIAALVWKNIVVRYKQAYLGLLWAVLKPLMLMLIFTLVRSFVGIETGDIPYPILTFAALLPWIFFQESCSEGINSITANTSLIKKIYFPREVFPLTAMVTKLVELAISFIILAGLMIYYQMMPTIYALWVPAIILYTMLIALTISFFGAALNVYYRDVAQALPVALCMLLVEPSLLIVVYVMVAQAISGIAKDLNKMSAKSSIKLVAPNNAQGKLYQIFMIFIKNTLCVGHIMNSSN
jgi:lipopolysaccharide transport system permease protein